MATVGMIGLRRKGREGGMGLNGGNTSAVSDGVVFFLNFLDFGFDRRWRESVEVESSLDDASQLLVFFHDF